MNGIQKDITGKNISFKVISFPKTVFEVIIVKFLKT